MGMLGIIGGMGPAATDLLYRRIIDRTDAECDQEHLDMIILNHASMPDRTAAIKSGETDKVLSLLKKDVEFLKNAGASAIAIPCNTSHYFYDALQKSTEVTIINMIRETAKYVKALGRKKVCVLATDGTIMTGIYEKEILAEGIEYVAPDEKTQKLVMKIIYEQVKKGFPGNEEDFREIHHFIKANGCDGAILACTELSVFREEAGLTDFYTDALEVLCERSILSCGKNLREMV
ncbi:MAG: amino acid racemase [Eubacteriales bacterium]|nr:amino acid racemase [Eubacteriales bacterium]